MEATHARPGFRRLPLLRRGPLYRELEQGAKQSRTRGGILGDVENALLSELVLDRAEPTGPRRAK
jgi:hypothetical protein